MEQPTEVRQVVVDAQANGPVESWQQFEQELRCQRLDIESPEEPLDATWARARRSPVKARGRRRKSGLDRDVEPLGHPPERKPPRPEQVDV